MAQQRNPGTSLGGADAFGKSKKVESVAGVYEMTEEVPPHQAGELIVSQVTYPAKGEVMTLDEYSGNLLIDRKRRELYDARVIGRLVAEGKMKKVAQI